LTGGEVLKLILGKTGCEGILPVDTGKIGGSCDGGNTHMEFLD